MASGASREKAIGGIAMQRTTKKPHPQLELFVAADVLSWSPKADRHSMEHPFFSIWGLGSNGRLWKAFHNCSVGP